MTLEYAIRIERLAASDGGGYLATAPDLPGCMSDGATPEEGLENIQDAIASWLDEARRLGREPPPPRSYALAG